MTETFGGFPLTWPIGVPRLKDWDRKESKFKTAFGQSRDRLMAELKALGADLKKGIVISSNVTLRQDGLPYAGQANPKDPAVAVYFWLDGKQRVFGCDRYRKVACNLHAVALTIEALRGIKRWGTSQMFEQAFTGFTALPPAPKAPRAWRQALGFNAIAFLTMREVSVRRKELASICHPDSGSEPNHWRMAEINAAYEEARAELEPREAAHG